MAKTNVCLSVQFILYADKHVVCLIEIDTSDGQHIKDNVRLLFGKTEIELS